MHPRRLVAPKTPKLQGFSLFFFCWFRLWLAMDQRSIMDAARVAWCVYDWTESVCIETVVINANSAYIITYSYSIILYLTVLQSFSGLTRCSTTYLGAVLAGDKSHNIIYFLVLFLDLLAYCSCMNCRSCSFRLSSLRGIFYQCFTSMMETNSIEIRYLSFSNMYMNIIPFPFTTKIKQNVDRTIP